MNEPRDVPALKDYLPLARRLARDRARAPADLDDLVQEGMIALHRALLEASAPEGGGVRDPWAFGRTVLDRAMRHWYRDGRWETRWEGVVPESGSGEEGDPLPRLPSPTGTGGPDVLGEFLRDLEAEVGEAHAWVAENLFAPTDELGAWVLREMRRKAAALEEDPGLDLRGVETARVSHRLIREALGWTPSRWAAVLGEVRAFTRTWMTRRGMAAPPP